MKWFNREETMLEQQRWSCPECDWFIAFWVETLEVRNAIEAHLKSHEGGVKGA